MPLQDLNQMASAWQDKNPKLRSPDAEDPPQWDFPRPGKTHAKLPTRAYMSAADHLCLPYEKERVAGLGEMERRLLSHSWVISWAEFSPKCLKNEEPEGNGLVGLESLLSYSYRVVLEAPWEGPLTHPPHWTHLLHCVRTKAGRHSDSTRKNSPE